VTRVKYLAAEIMPRVWEKRPNVQLVIVGKDPAADVYALGADPRITITGTVDDIRPYLWRATIAVVPLIYGAGIQNKILESMACGTPVITTPRTLSSLNVTPGKELLIADDADGFSQTVLQLLGSPEKLAVVGSAGVEYVRMHHSWAAIAEQLIICYTGAMKELKKNL